MTASPPTLTAGDDVRPARRGGYTLVEVLAAIGIVGLLCALLLPVIAQTRSSAQRLACSNRLRQIATAIQAYVGDHSVLPPSHFGVANPRGGRMERLDDFSPLVRLLPYLDGDNVWQHVNFTADMRSASFVEATLARLGLSTFLCPSDPLAARGCSSFRFSSGALPAPVPRLALSGCFPAPIALRPAEVTDGLSRTCSMAEKPIGSGGAYSTFRDAAALTSEAPDSLAPRDWVGACSTLAEPISTVDASWGRSWVLGSKLYYDHILPPNSLVIDCFAFATVPPIGLRTARSYHGPVHCAFLDGHVELIDGAISPSIWRALGTIAGNDAVQ